MRESELGWQYAHQISPCGGDIPLDLRNVITAHDLYPIERSRPKPKRKRAAVRRDKPA
jgi:hypothetical protein